MKPALASRDVLVELCIQREYLDPASPNCCVNAPEVRRNVKHIMALARLVKIPVMSCVDLLSASCRNGPAPDSGHPAAVLAAYARLPDYRVVESDNCLSVALDLFSKHQQVIFTKVHRDPFTNPKLDRLLTEMPANRFVVFGVPLESSLRTLILGLGRRKRRSVLLYDACGFWNRKEAEMVLRQLQVKGCLLMTTAAYMSEQFAGTSARRLGLRLRPSRSVA